MFPLSKAIWWGHVYHLQIPLENIENDTWTFKITLTEMAMNAYKPLRSNVGKFRMDKETVVNSGLLNLEMKDVDGNWKRAMKLEIGLEITCWSQAYSESVSTKH